MDSLTQPKSQSPVAVPLSASTVDSLEPNDRHYRQHWGDEVTTVIARIKSLLKTHFPHSKFKFGGQRLDHAPLARGGDVQAYDVYRFEAALRGGDILVLEIASAYTHPLRTDIAPIRYYRLQDGVQVHYQEAPLVDWAAMTEKFRKCFFYEQERRRVSRID